MLINHQTSFGMSILTVAILQGAIAAGLSRVFKLASWWLAIQFIFPIAAIGVQALKLPPTAFLIAFVILLGLYWSTFRTQVPFYPSSPATWKAVTELLPTDRPLQFIDIGSGLGGLSLHLARARPDCKFLGIELAPLPWLVSVLRVYVSRSPAQFIRGDYTNLDFSQYDVVFAYLSPVAMTPLWEKAKAEMRPNSLLLSYEFPIADKKWNIIKSPAQGGPNLYGWQM